MTTLPTKLSTAETCEIRTADAHQSKSLSPVRVLLAGTGIGCVGLAGIGAIVPGLPTTVFLIIAVWCFTRSCPWLTDRLVRIRFFGPFLRYLEPDAVMPRRAKVVATCAMWLAIIFSSALLLSRSVTPLVPAIIMLAGIVGTVCIVRQGHTARRSPALKPESAGH
ncbi:MAG: YbaN family protein [Phycisphaeraceae bacterium]|nr:YbaN family protein [Phycisphaeraceae bacterium]MCW5767706.1 YbaN family protein [Phycisphaeraceae bacterium]